MKPSAIAIVGMAGRFPGARNIREFWQNLRSGVESIRDLSDAELLAAGVSAEELASPDYVKRASVLDDVALFDAGFFGFSPRDASIMDPQHRHFLECAWEALEDAGHPPQRFDGSIGVFAGSGMNTYLIHNLLANRRLLASAGLFQLKQTGNDKDVLATRVSYQFDLRGPSINIQTACSTSLVAVHLACQSLLNFECDMALAGGVTIEIPHGQGYLYREGEILSRDGHCRSFDASSSGTVFGSGLGIVVLRRLEDALEDHDNIRAVILGSAINNDGARKVGYLAPSVEGQAEVIAEALDFAGVSAGDISYVEAHGTGTVVGDPIEVRALTQAFRKSTARSAYCGIGSLKASVGHLDAAAGVAGLIKTVLALEHAQIPASLHFEKLNPHIALADSPFYVNATLKDWTAAPRRAGVTALGIGGTNAHVVLEEAPPPSLVRQQKPRQLLIVSAKSAAAADRAFVQLAAHVESHPQLNLADVAFTCQLGRHAFAHRRAMVVADTLEARSALVNTDRKRLALGQAGKTPPEVVFLFSGQGAQYADMGLELYEQEPVFRQAIDQCAQLLLGPLGFDLRTALFPTPEEKDAAAEKLNQTWLTQPALFTVEYALARWWIELGVEPAAMVGHSIGECVAACLAGVFSLEDALALVALRGRLMYDLPSGSMLAVPLAAADLRLNGMLSLAAINGPELCVVSGPEVGIARLEQELAGQAIACRRLHTSHAFHSAMMDPILEAFEERLRGIAFHSPLIPYLSNVSGAWIKAEEAMDPGYWARHLRHTVRFADCLAVLAGKPNQVLIEVGPGNTLTALARRQGLTKAYQSLPHPRETVSALGCALQTLGQMWVAGVDIQWAKLHAPGSVQRVSLPTYPFEHQRFWIEADKAQPTVAASEIVPENKGTEIYRRVWRTAPVVAASAAEPARWMIFNDTHGLGDELATHLKRNKHQVILVEEGEHYRRLKRDRYQIRPGVRGDYDALFADVAQSGFVPRRIAHLWSVLKGGATPTLGQTLERSFYSPLYLAQALTAQDIAEMDIALVSNRMQQVAEEAVFHPERAVLLGPARVISKELPGLVCRSMDVELGSGPGAEECAAQIVAEMAAPNQEASVAYRGGVRFVESLDAYDLSSAQEKPRLRPGGVYLITGGLGGLGLVVAEHLAREFQARLVLVGRSALPDEAEWEAALLDPAQSDAIKTVLRKLILIRSLAGGLLVAQGDVTNLAEMRDVAAKARQRYGKIDGVFHAAGVLDDGPLLLKTAESASRVLDAKVRGTLVLDEAMDGEPLSCFVLFSSISSIFPPAGQVDYAAANAFLDAFAASRGERVTVVNWGAWDEVGMGARPATGHPLLERRLLEDARATVYASQFSQQKQWFLSEHRFKTGQALIPGTGYLEMVAAAFGRGSIDGALEFENVFFLAPLTFGPDESREVRVQLKRDRRTGTHDAASDFAVFAKPPLSRDGAWVEHCSGWIATCAGVAPDTVDRTAIAARCHVREIVFDEQHRTKQERYFDFGPRWHCLSRLAIGKHEGLAELALDTAFAADLPTYRMHPALLDLATGCALYLTDGYVSSEDLYLPFSYRRLCVYRPFPLKMFSHIRSREENQAGGEVATFDITLFDEQDRVLAQIEGFTMRRMTEAAMAERDNSLPGEALAGEQPIAVEERFGIPPLEGARTLTRILQKATPSRLVAVAHGFRPIAALRPTEPAKPQAARYSRAAESRPPAAGSIETVLAGWWQELLGVEHVDLEDDFFDLGGHSLIGVRLFAKIKKSYSVDLELASLFEARSVRQIAELIRKAQQPAEAQPKAWSALVPIQPKGSRIPLFCVHAVGGDVLFYQQLAAALGRDQPFYGLQSPLAALADLRPTSLEELASIYIQEIRAFLPQGPYLIGGASYGGLVAFEMAKQLRAQGKEPALLVLFDTSVPGSEHIVEAKARAAGFIEGLRRQGAAYLVKKAQVKTDYWKEILAARWRVLACNCYRMVGRPLPTTLRYFYMDWLHRLALAHYKFQPYGGKITLMRAIDRGPEVLGKREDETLGWGALAGGGLEIHDVPTAHMMMLFDPYVTSFAENLKAILPS